VLLKTVKFEHFFFLIKINFNLKTSQALSHKRAKSLTPQVCSIFFPFLARNLARNLFFFLKDSQFDDKSMFDSVRAKELREVHRKRQKCTLC
jgi:hypothetical protein